MGEGKTYIASETSAFSRFTKNFIAMKDGEIAVITGDAHHLDISRVEQAPDHDVLLTPAPYDHFTLKECMEQPQAIARALNYGARMEGHRVILGGLDNNADLMGSIRHLLISGCGTSKYAGEFGAKLMRDLDCFDSVMVVDSAEVRRSEIPKTSGGLLVISQSGETKDVHRTVKLAIEENIPVFSVVNAVGSLIARTTKMGVYLNAGREHAVASTKAFSSQVTVLSLIALWYRQHRESKEHLPESPFQRALLESLQRLPISFGMALGTRDKCKEIAKELVKKESLFVLGKGYGECIAYEGALKIKELSYLHAEGFSGGALKHGPFALIEGASGPHGQTPVICLLLDDDHASTMRTAAEEVSRVAMNIIIYVLQVKARGARVYVITDNPNLARGLDSNPVVIPSNGPLTALTAVLPLQV